MTGNDRQTAVAVTEDSAGHMRKSDMRIRKMPARMENDIESLTHTTIRATAVDARLRRKLFKCWHPRYQYAATSRFSEEYIADNSGGLHASLEDTQQAASERRH